MRNLIRIVYFYFLAFLLFLLAGSLILQYGFNLEPCPLCVLARIIVILLTINFATAFWHNPKKNGQLVYASIALFLIAIGIGITGYHLWLLNLPADKMPSCGPSLNYLITHLPIKDALLAIFQSTGECAKNPQKILYLPLPAWTLLAFASLGIATVWVLFKSRNK